MIKSKSENSGGTMVKSENNDTSVGSCFAYCTVKFSSFIIAVFVTAAILTWRYGVPNSHIMLLTGNVLNVGDNADDFSTILCQKYDVTTTVLADSFLLSAGTGLDFNNKIKFKEQDFIKGMDRPNYSYYTADMDETSVLTVEACRLNDTTFDAQLLVIKGEKNFNKFMNEKCTNCVAKSLEIPKNNWCTSDAIYPPFSSMKYYVNSTDKYYVVDSSPGGDIIRGTIIKPLFPIDHVKQKCILSSVCSLDLDFASGEEIVVIFRGTTIFGSTYLDTNCHLRDLFWAGIFGLLPLGLILLVVLFGCFCTCALRERPAKRRQQKTGTENPSYVT